MGFWLAVAVSSVILAAISARLLYLSRKPGPAGAGLQSLDEEQRARAREEMHRQLGSPDGAFELTGTCYAARVSTDARSAPVPTSVT